MLKQLKSLNRGDAMFPLNPVISGNICAVSVREIEPFEPPLSQMAIYLSGMAVAAGFGCWLMFG